MCPYWGAAQYPPSHYRPGGPFWSCRKPSRWYAKDFDAGLLQIASMADNQGLI